MHSQEVELSHFVFIRDSQLVEGFLADALLRLDEHQPLLVAAFNLIVRVLVVHFLGGQYCLFEQHSHVLDLVFAVLVGGEVR
jgi:hypothetical protein